LQGRKSIETIAMLNETNDGVLLEMISKKDDQAFDLLYKIYWDPLLNYATQFLKDGDSGEEVVQDLFVHLHSRHSPLKIHTSVSSYLYTALRNRILNHERNKAVYKKHISIASKGNSESNNNVEQFINLAELRKGIDQSVKQMPAKYREVYVLHDRHQYSTRKIAALLNRPVDTVEKQLRKAFALLRGDLKNSILDR
jgi:RNA polymerase sigma-19 factor, ECF subfamily